MGLFDRLFGDKNSSDKLSEEELIEAGACPNCWGEQEYDDKFLQHVEDQTKANISNRSKKAFVAQFVETNITGIRLKSEGEQLSCPACKMKYKKVSSKLN